MLRLIDLIEGAVYGVEYDGAIKARAELYKYVFASCSPPRGWLGLVGLGWPAGRPGQPTWLGAATVGQRGYKPLSWAGAMADCGCTLGGPNLLPPSRVKIINTSGNKVGVKNMRSPADMLTYQASEGH